MTKTTLNLSIILYLFYFPAYINLPKVHVKKKKIRQYLDDLFYFGIAIDFVVINFKILLQGNFIIKRKKSRTNQSRILS